MTPIDRLVRDHLGLVDRVARTLRARSFRDDLVSAGREGLFHAARSFDPSRGVPFEKFARARIHGAMTDQLRSWGHLPRRAYRRAVDAGDPIARSALNIDDFQLSDHTTPETAFAREEQLAMVRLHITKLPPPERVMVRTVYFDGENGKDAAARLGLSKSWGSRVLKRGLLQLTKMASRLPPPRCAGARQRDRFGRSEVARPTPELACRDRSWCTPTDGERSAFAEVSPRGGPRASPAR